MPSNKFHLNEMRVNRAALDRFPILIAEGLGLSQRHAFLLQRKITQTFHTPAISFEGSLAIILTDSFKPNDYWDFLASEELKDYSKVATTFGRQIFKMRRRLLGAILGYCGRQQNIFQEGFLDFYEYTSDSGVFYNALNITALEDTGYYRLFLEPGCNVMYPLTSLNLEPLVGQNLRVLEIPPSEPDKLGGGFLGFLVSVEAGSKVNLEEELILVETQAETVAQFARLKRTRKSLLTYLVPGHLVLVKPSYGLLVQQGHLRSLRDKTLVRPSERLQQLNNWYQKLFPDDSVSAGAKLTAKVELNFGLIEPVEYDATQDQETFTISYPDNPLKFGPRQPGNIEITDPYHGIREYGPWDLRSKDRPFDSIRPYIIYPRDSELKKKIYQLFKYFDKGGYTDSAKASRYDRSFRGFAKEFHAPFIMPKKEEEAGKECETDEQYLEAADVIIEKWTASDGDPSRIAIIVFPFDQEDSLEDVEYSKDLYPRLKQKFIQAGLPCQMIDRSTLEKIQFQDGKPYFDEESYFGHILWNLALNIYVKLGGRPWTLQRELDNVNCLIGLSFTVNTLQPNRPMYVGIANIFDEFGEWVDVAPDQTKLTDEELKAWYEAPHLFYSTETASSKLPREFTAQIVKKSVEGYKNRRNNYPLNIVIHKTGTIHQVEIEGVLEGIKAAGISFSHVTIGFVSLIQNHSFRIYGEADADWRDNFVVRRGIMRLLETDRALLATTGRTESSRHSLGTPQPLEIRIEHPSPEVLERLGLDRINQYSITQLSEQLMALTQLHWGSTRKEIKLPVTILYSQKVASLSTRAEIASLPPGRIHRPWFI